MHQMMFAAPKTRSSSSNGSPSRTPIVLETRFTPAASRSRGLTRMAGAPLERIFGRALRPMGVFTVSTRWKTNRSARGAKRSREAVPSMRNGMWPVSLPDSQVRWVRESSSEISAPNCPSPR